MQDIAAILGLMVEISSRERIRGTRKDYHRKRREYLTAATKRIQAHELFLKRVAFGDRCKPPHKSDNPVIYCMELDRVFRLKDAMRIFRRSKSSFTKAIRDRRPCAHYHWRLLGDLKS